MPPPEDPTGSERFAGLISVQQRADLDWMVDTIKPVKITEDGKTTFRVTQISQLLQGYMTAIAVEHQDWTFWQVLHEAHRAFLARPVAPS